MNHTSALPVLLLLLALPASPARGLDLDRYADLLQRHTRAVSDPAGTRVDYDALRGSSEWRVLVAGLDADDPDAAFDDHVRKIRDTAEWGGQPELLALARALRRPIRVHARDAPLLEMGAEFDGAPLVVAYHRHYYALGEHYNSTEAADA